MTARPSSETEIRLGAGPLTEITFLHCHEDHQPAALERAVAYAKKLRGSRGCAAVNVLKSTEGSRVCLYNQWNDASAAKAAHDFSGDPGWADQIDTDSGGPRLYDVVYADDRSPERVTTIGPSYKGAIFINEIMTIPEKQDRLLQLVIANNEASSLKTPGYRSANFHKSHDGQRAVNYSLWDTEDHLIEAISDMAKADVNLEETIAIANPDFRFYELVYSDHA